MTDQLPLFASPPAPRERRRRVIEELELEDAPWRRALTRMIGALEIAHPAVSSDAEVMRYGRRR